MMLSRIPKGIFYAVAFLGIVLGLIWHSWIFGLITVVLIGYLINVILWGYYFYRATSILILAVLLVMLIGFVSNLTNASLMLFMAVDVIL